MAKTKTKTKTKKNGAPRQRRSLTVAASELARLGNQAEDLKGRITKKEMELQELGKKLGATKAGLAGAYATLAKLKPPDFSTTMGPQDEDSDDQT